MTSKSLFFKLMREDMKRRVWALGLAFLMFFFWMPVVAAMSISSLKQNLERWIATGASFGDGVTAQMEYQSRLMALVEEILGLKNPMVILTIGTAAFVLALTGFMYLHSRKQVDFYHSIPVRREVIFAVRYIDGLLIVLSMYLLNLLFAIGVFAANGIGPSVTVQPAFVALLIHMAGFLLIYGLMTIAVLLTGNFFISILGGIVLFSYIPALVALVEGLMYLFFVTVNSRELPLSNLAGHGSPLTYYASLIGEGHELELAEYGTLAGQAALALVAALVMALVAMALYRKRPSEAAGKAMAFKLTKTPIKVLLVVPVTIFVAVLLWNVYYSMAWAVFGFLLGLVLTHGIIEVIYHFEFRKILANPVHMGICAVLALAVIGFFRYDVAGYDSYLPKEGEFQSASIYGYGMKDWNGYGLPVKDEYGYSWSYMDDSNYAVGNMEITDYDLVRAIAMAGIENAESTRESQLSDRWDTASEEDGYWLSLEVGYRLKNGKRVYRNYNVDVLALRDTFDRLYCSEEYKKGIYPVLSYQPDGLTGVYESRDGKIQKVDVDAGTMSELLSAYQEELTALTLEERSKETPVTSLRFLTLAEYDYLKYVTSSRVSNYSGDFRIDDMRTVNFFAVYPSFTRTLALLKEAGIDLTETIGVDDVVSIDIYCDNGYDTYAEDISASHGWVYDEELGRSVLRLVNDGSQESREKIAEILASSEVTYRTELNGLQPCDRTFTVQVLLGNDESLQEEKVLMNFRYQEVPQFVREATGYDSEGFMKAVYYGLYGYSAN